MSPSDEPALALSSGLSTTATQQPHGGAGREGTMSRARVAAPSRILSDCTYIWERTVMGISVLTAETVKATTPY